MPPKTRKSTRKAPGKVAKVVPADLTAEEQQARDQCDLLLKDFDKHVESSKAEAAREAKTAGDSISTLYKLELMKISSETKAMSWDDYVKQHGLGLSEAVADVLDASILQVDVQIDNAKSAVKKGRGRKMPTSAKKAAATSRKPSDDLQTPVQSRRPPASSKTPMITPKFDVTAAKLNRTVSRTAKAGEVLVSLSGSPVAPLVTARSKAGQEIAGSNAQIPLGDGSTLNMPLADAELEENALLDLDDEQTARLEQLHANLGNMLKIKAQNMTML